MNYRTIERSADISRTVLARDYKGFGSSHETSNGIIERYDYIRESSPIDI